MILFTKSQPCVTVELFSPCRGIPYVGPIIQSPFSEYLEKQKANLHRKPGQEFVQVHVRPLTMSNGDIIITSIGLTPLMTVIDPCINYCILYMQESSRIQMIFGYLLLAMIVYFVLSIVHSMAQRYAKRIQEMEIHTKLHPDCHYKTK